MVLIREPSQLSSSCSKFARSVRSITDSAGRFRGQTEEKWDTPDDQICLPMRQSSLKPTANDITSSSGPGEYEAGIYDNQYVVHKSRYCSVHGRGNARLGTSCYVYRMFSRNLQQRRKPTTTTIICTNNVTP